MPPKTPISLGKSSYESVSLPFAAQRCVNLYVNPAQAESLSDYMLFGTPGVTQLSTLGSGVSRGAIVMDGVYYIVSGTTLYSVNSSGVGTSRGTVAGTARVSMAHNGEKLCIVVPGGNGYVYNATTTVFAQITDSDYQTADTVCFKDGYYVFTKTNSNIFFHSALNDPLTFDALDFGTAEQSPGNIIGCHANYDEVVIFKKDYSERFQNVGGSGFVFQRIPGASFEKGSWSKYSPIQWEGAFYFIGGGDNERAEIYEAAGTGEPRKISTNAIAQEMQKFTEAEIRQAFSFAYSIQGNSFVGFTFRSINIDSKTFVYNVTASRFFRRPIWFEQQTGIEDNAWRANSVNFAYDKLIVSDNIDGRLGYLDAEEYKEYGETILRHKTLPPLSAQGASIFIYSLELTLESGIGLISGQGNDPEIMLDWSDDGARTWSSEITRKPGKIGQYRRRVEWRRLGRCDSHRVFRAKMSDPVKCAWIKAEGGLQVGR